MPRLPDDRILDAAAAVFAERGDAASMAEIAVRAGVGRATLYRRFADRDALLVALSDQVLARLGEGIAATEPDTGRSGAEIVQRMTAVVQAFLSLAGEYAALIPLLSKNPERSRRFDGEVIVPVRSLLTRARRLHVIDPGVDDDDVFELFSALLGVGVRLVARGVDPGVASDFVVRALLRGIGDEGDPSSSR